MKIAIIGGSGFIGTRVARIAEESNIDYIILDKVKSASFPEKWIFADVIQLASLKEGLKGTDVILNLAAEHKDDVTPVSLYHEVNVIGAQNVCKAAEYLGIRKIIFTSSVAVYGLASKGTDESTECRPFNEYGRTKLQAEAVYIKWMKDGTDRKLNIIRPTVVFGEGNRGNVYNLIRQISSKRFIMIGNGRNVKSMAYVENVARFLMYLIENNETFDVCNYVDTPHLDMNELVAMVRDEIKINDKGNRIRIPLFMGFLIGILVDTIGFILKKKFSISLIRIRKFCSDSNFESNLLSTLSFVPSIDIRTAVKKTVAFESGRDSV